MEWNSPEFVPFVVGLAPTRIPGMPTLKALSGLTFVAAAGVSLVACGLGWLTSAPTFTRRLPWAGTGVWLKAETHTHTKFSDGSSSVDELADRAVASGCDVLAITDHSDGNLKAATPEYHDAIRATRARLPQLILLAGLEWNPPPGKGQDHAAMLLPAAWDTAERTEEFKRRFDDLNKEGENPELATAAFAWIREHSASPEDLPVIVLNHPGRRAKDVEAVWRAWSFLTKEGAGIVVGAEGAPGHQNAKPLGAYGGALVPEDRWDPSVVAPGAAWDRLLQQGQDVWGALASSDFHAESNGDYWPCQFSYTAIYAPDRSAAGVLRALRAGSFVGVHGGIVRSAELRVMTPELERAALAGEQVRVPAGATLSVDLVMDLPGTDWSGAANHIDAIDLIGISKDGARIVASGAPGADGRWHAEVTAPAGGIVLRARGRRVIDDGPDLLFYTNAVRATD
jgi:PHP domain